jgi:DNA-binding protein H-NS
MEDIIAYSIIGILPLGLIYGAVLLRRLFVRSRQQKLKLQQERLERQQERIESIAKQSRERERQRIQEIEAIAKTYGVGGVVGRQEYDLNTNTVRTSVHDPKTNTTKYVTTPAAQIAPGTVLPHAANNSSTDLFTGMAIGGLVNSLFSTTAYSKSTDDSDSSSSWSDSSDSGPSSDW